MPGSPALPGALVVANADAGTHDHESLEAALGPLRATGAPVEVARTGSPAEVREALTGADGRVVVAAGGDGTLHAVVQGLFDLGLLETTVGLLPLGTGNDFARATGIPLDPEEAGRCLVTAPARPTDLLVDDQGTVVVNAAHAGMSADVSHRAEDLKDRLGGGAYAVSAFLEGISTTGFTATVEVDGAPLVQDADLLLFGVGVGATIGGGTPLFPDAHVDDGRAEVMVCLATGMFARMGFAAGLRSGEHITRDDVLVAAGEEVVLRGDPVRHSIDGEVSDPTTERRYRLFPAAWRILRPA